MKTGADWIVELLHHSGVQIVFGFPGESSLPLYVSMHRSSFPIKHIVARCEKCACYMSDAYARISGRPAVCDAPGGIGSTMLPPALNEAFNSSIPLVIITSGTPASVEGKWPTSHCDQVAMLSPLVKATIRAKLPERMPEYLRRAFRLATSPRCGPVHVEVPSDLLGINSELSADLCFVDSDCQRYPSSRTRPDAAVVRRVLDTLRRARRPLIMAGGGVLLAQAESDLLALVERAHLPVVTTLNGKGALPESHPLSLGVIGAKGNPDVNPICRESDWVLVLGSKLGDTSANYWTLFSPDATLVHCDSDPSEIGRNLRTELGLVGDVKLVCQDLCSAPESMMWATSEDWLARVERAREASREPVVGLSASVSALMEEINERYATDAIIAADASQACGWIGAYFRPSQAGRSVLAPRGSGSIGYALPAAIGAKLASPQSRVVAIGGDGGFAMASHELETAVRYGLDITFVILNNNSLGMINQVARDLYGEPDLMGEFTPTDWSAVAEAYGCAGARATSPAELKDALDLAEGVRAPVVIDYVVETGVTSPDVVLKRERWNSLHRETGA